MLGDILRDRKAELHGAVLSPLDAERLASTCPTWLLDAWREAPLTGARLYLDDKVDPTGVGVSMQWMTAVELLSEATEASPGREALPAGFVPIGKCLEGSGDPYFVSQGEDSGLVRIPHSAARGGRLNPEAIERITKSLSEFFRIAKIR